MAEEKNSQIISWTYNEPVIWAEYILETMREARARKKKFSSVLVSAGLANPEAWADILALTDACSLDIKGWGNSFYKKLTGFPGFLRVLENAQAAYTAGCHLEIVTNVMQDWNDDDASLVSLAEWIGENLSPDIPWHLTASRPAHKLMNLQPTHIRTIERAVSIGKKAGLRYVYGGNVAGAELQTTSCPECAHALIKRSAFSVQSCLVTQDTQCAERACCPKCGTKIYGRF
jgi:pyruvate formate lyase activating enzyme